MLVGRQAAGNASSRARLRRASASSGAAFSMLTGSISARSSAPRRARQHFGLQPVAEFGGPDLGIEHVVVQAVLQGEKLPCRVLGQVMKIGDDRFDFAFRARQAFVEMTLHAVVDNGGDPAEVELR